ncbi:MAG: aminopeptidase P family N-terminal domain-containing protein, partial [Alphaproteobacteria bacterium]|nr:aminopeptidase P family N-terminal domain-containing protein [Alphaproteobacteria bacterium]
MVDSNSAHLALLREELARRGLDGFVVPRADEHQGEHVPFSAERLAWVTGFTGSAGTAVILAARAALFVDGRYTLQGATETMGTGIEIVHVTERQFDDWLVEALSEDMRLGYDPRLHTGEGRKRLEKVCKRATAHHVSTDDNPADAVWQDRPAPPLALV